MTAMHKFDTPFELQQRARRLEPIHRRGLEESLQQFAQRLGGPDVDVEKYRRSWALQGLRFLAPPSLPPDLSWERIILFIGDGARIAPGVSVPTKQARL